MKITTKDLSVILGLLFWGVVFLNTTTTNAQTANLQATALLPIATQNASSTNNKTAKELAKDTELKILTWNVNLLPFVYAPFTWRCRTKQFKRIKWISEYLNESDIDIVVFQEVFTPIMTKKLRKKLEEIYPYQVRSKNKKWTTKPGDGVLIVSRVPIEQIDHIFYTESYDYDGLANKGCVMVSGNKDGIPFQLTGTHLQSINHREAHVVRVTQARQIREQLLDKHYKKGVPQFVVGDLNVRKSIPDWYEEIMLILDGAETPPNDDRMYTFDNNNYWLKKHPERHDDVFLDYILLRDNGSKTQVQTMEIIRKTKRIKGTNYDYADHYGLLATVKLRK